jgi:hypothetical protein
VTAPAKSTRAIFFQIDSEGISCEGKWKKTMMTKVDTMMNGTWIKNDHLHPKASEITPPTGPPREVPKANTIFT